MGIVQTDEEQSCIQDGRRGRRNGQGKRGTWAERLCSRGSADPRESLRKCWISKLALNAHKVSLRFPLPVPSSSAGFWLRLDATVVCSFKVIVSVECCTFLISGDKA